jgi:hypothetical protein
MNMASLNISSAAPAQARPGRLPARLLSILVFGLVIGSVIAPVLVNMIATHSDYWPHIRTAHSWATTGQFDRPTPQFLYHVTLAGLQALNPTADWAMNAFLLGMVNYLALAGAAWWLIRPALSHWGGRAALLAGIGLVLVLLLSGPVNLFTLLRGELYLGYLNPNTYHNPTVLILKPFALVVFIFLVRGLQARATPWWMVGVAALVSALATLAKPNLAIALLPALMLLIPLAWLRKQPMNLPLLILGLGAPTFLVLAWQYLSYTSPESGGGFIFAPFQVMNTFTSEPLLRLLLSIAFPAAVYGLWFKDARRDLGLNSAWLLFGIAAAQLYLMSESTYWQDANFYWGAEITLFILFAVSLRFFFQQQAGAPPGRSWRRMLCLGLFALHLMGGLLLYAFHLGPHYIAMW